MRNVTVLSVLLLTACVTINIYFPAAAAEKAADEIIQDIQKLAPPPVPSKPKASLSDWQSTIDTALAWVISPAQAEAADLSLASPEISKLRATMATRFAALQPFYAAGFIGIQADGLLAVRDVPLKDKNQVAKLVAAENKDRLQLYQAIANANGHPDWANQIKATFAERWVNHARAGWWYQSSGSWTQK